MRLRIPIIGLSLITAYAAAYAGDGMHFVMTDGDPTYWKGAVVVSWVITIAMGLVAAVIWVAGMVVFFKEELSCDDQETMIFSIMLIAALMLYGAGAAPFTNHGALPWHWASKWNIIPLLAIMMFTIVVANDFLSREK